MISNTSDSASKEKNSGIEATANNLIKHSISLLDFSLESILSGQGKKRKLKKRKLSSSDEEIIAKPGQKYKEPPLDDPLRAFYESLYDQNPKSPMARKYCIEHGLISEEKLSKILSSKSKKNK